MDSAVHIAMSEMADGSMSAAVTADERLANRRRFLEANGVTAGQTVLVRLRYEGDDYRRYFSVGVETAGDGIMTPSTVTADALFTQDRNLALLLPIADCIAAVLYDPILGALGLAHLGRHNLLQDGGAGIVAYMSDDFGSKPSDIRVWLSPAAGRGNYPLFDFDNRSLHEVALEQLLAAGITAANVITDPRDTTLDERLFSHSEYLKGKRVSDGRQAVMAVLR